MTKQYISVTELDDSGSTCAVSQSLQPLPGGITPNLLINGGFDIWQRGATFSVPFDYAKYTADRWYLATTQASGVEGTVSQQAADAETPNAQFVLRIKRDTNTAGDLILEQPLDSPDIRALRGNKVTLTFRARKGSATGTNTLKVRVYSGTGTTPKPRAFTAYTGESALIDEIVTVTDEFPEAVVEYTSTLVVPDSAGEFSVQFECGFTGSTNADDYIELTDVKLESGELATPFVSRPYGEELALCKRYFERRNGDGSEAFCTGYAQDTRVFVTHLDFEVEKRATPSLTFSSQTSFVLHDWFATNHNLSAVTNEELHANQTNVHTSQVRGWAASDDLLTVRSVLTLVAAETDAYIDIDAEL